MKDNLCATLLNKQANSSLGVGSGGDAVVGASVDLEDKLLVSQGDFYLVDPLGSKIGRSGPRLHVMPTLLAEPSHSEHPMGRVDRYIITLSLRELRVIE